MRRIPAALAFTALTALLLACGGQVSFTNGPAAPPAATGPAGSPSPVDPGPPIVLSAQQLGQEFNDDPNGTTLRYRRKLLQVKGAVAERDKPGVDVPVNDANDPVGGIVFRPVVTDKKTGENKQYALHCFFDRPVAANDPHYAELAVGRAVTVQGHITGANVGSPSASLGGCILVDQ